ncbi:hypothetical protein [Embleya sp. NPDC020630]|uniref:hypothetical protein n=1 Tax=Embleya sp. NPDC020630 TaxID=3363979 RepID=UPI0037BDD35C
MVEAELQGWSREVGLRPEMGVGEVPSALGPKLAAQHRIPLAARPRQGRQGVRQACPEQQVRQPSQQVDQLADLVAV